jgi:phosphatidylinositol glycan class M
MSWLTFPRLIFLSVLLRLALFFHGLHQDAHSTLKYTDIDYYVFTDAARYLAQGLSPYRRDTFRYTPILAYVLYPTTIWFNFGKFLFATADVVAGWGIYRILMLSRGMEEKRAVWYTACCWLLNPIVATISTRGSSEGLLGVIVIGLLWATMSHRIVTAGALLGFATHFKIYPIIYAPAILLWLDSTPTTIFTNPTRFLCQTITRNRIVFALSALGTFFGLNFALYYVYGHEFLHHTYLHHFVRLDHRHNFSPYNVLLYLVSSPTGRSEFPFAKWAFLPQMFLSAVAVPLVGARKDLPGTMFLQTFAFVAFNKVCTSQVLSPPSPLEEKQPIYILTYCSISCGTSSSYRLFFHIANS